MLIDQVKRKLNVTWSDVDTDARIADIMDSVAPALRHKLGITDPKFDFEEPGMEKTLFLNMCFYEWNHSANEFDDNYANEIAQCRAIHEVESQESEGEADDTTS